MARPNAVALRTYTDNLTTLALRLVGEIHDGTPETVDAALAACRVLTPPRGTNTDEILITLLAAMVNPDQPRSQLLGWTTRRDGHPADLIPQHPVEYRSNPLAVEMACNGVLPLDSLNPAEQHHVIGILARRRWTTNQIADQLSVEPERITRIRASRKAAAA